MASTADIQVKASRGSTTQELHKDALGEKKEHRVEIKAGKLVVIYTVLTKISNLNGFNTET